jgi:neutral ceramidase
MTQRLQRTVVRLSVVICLALLLVDRALAGPPTPLLKAGFAERDVTPEIGMEQPGGYGKSYHRSVHDPCKVRAAVFDDGKMRVALVGIDAIAVHQEMVLAARKAIHQRCAIAPEAILIGASHSHSSGPIFGVRPGQLDGAPPLVQTLGYEKSTCVDGKYYERCLKEIIEAVCQADQNRAEARCGAGSGREDQVAFNRRFRMKNGLTHTHPRQGNPDIIDYAGPIDPEVGVIGAWNQDGKLLGCVVNYACHATTSPGGISANWIYYLEQTIRGSLGADAVVVFLQGCCGDITQVDNLSPYAFPERERWARLVGGRVGAEAVKVPPSGLSPRRSCFSTTTSPSIRSRRWRSRPFRSGRPCFWPTRANPSARSAWTSRPRARSRSPFPWSWPTGARATCPRRRRWGRMAAGTRHG